MIHRLLPRLASLAVWCLWTRPAFALQAAPEEGSSRSLGDLWMLEIVKIDGQSITVRKLVIGFALLLIGYFASRFLSRLLRRAVAPHMSLSLGAAAVIETLGFYVLLIVFTLSGLTVAGVPLTAFTLLGGAAAIGIGFGSQTIVSNFIAGLILMVERPIKVGNLIQIGDLFGTVESVRTRSTLVRTGSNVEIIVPNSSFLENNVINWTLNDPKVRISVSVGVTYGSPTDKVTDLLHAVVAEHPRALKTPKPTVLFTNFGDNSLDFEVHFWIEVQSMMDRRIAESDIRYSIDRRFREADIVIAFPQRDVHLDTLRPLDVRVVPDAVSE